MSFQYATQGTCSRGIVFDIQEGLVRGVQFIGGCSGNTQGVATLVEGMPVEEVIARLKGIRCGHKRTSCPDQLARALEEAMEEGKP